MKVLDTGIDVEPLDAVPALPGLLERYRGHKADAIQVPLGYMGIVNERVRSAVIGARWGGTIEGEGKLYVRNPYGGYAFATRDPRDLLYYPKSDAFTPGQARYDWYQDANDGGVMYGFLRFKEGR